MGGRFAMSSSTCCKMKALMILAMLAVGEGRRLQQMGDHRDRLKSQRAFSSRGAAGNEASPSLESDPGAPDNSPMDVLLNDPAFKEQLLAMAGHMDEFALLMKREAIADKMKENVKLNADLQEIQSKTLREQTLKTVSEQVAEVMTDPEFQQTLRRVSKALGSLMQDPEISVQAESLAAYLEPVKDLQASDIAEKVRVQVDAMVANKKLKAKASAVVYEMLTAESKDSSESTVDDELADELIALAENPTQTTGSRTRVDLERTLDKTLEAVKATTQDKALEAEKEDHLSFLEEWSGQEDDIPLLAVNPLLAAARVFQAKGFPGRNHVAIADQHTDQPEFGGWHRPSKPSNGAQMEDLWLGFEEWAKDKPALQQPKLAPGFPTSAHGIRSMRPSLKKALRSRGGFTEMVVKDGDGNAKKSFPVDVSLLLCFALWYLGNYYYNISNKLALTTAGGAALTRVVVALMMRKSLPPLKLIGNLLEKAKAMEKGTTVVASSALKKSATNMKSAMKACGQWAGNVTVRSAINIVAAFVAASCAGVEIFEVAAEEVFGLAFLPGVGGHHGVGIMALLHLFNAINEYYENGESFDPRKSGINTMAALAAASCAGLEVLEVAAEDCGLHFLQGFGGHHGVAIMALLHPFNALHRFCQNHHFFQNKKSFKENMKKLKITKKSAIHMVAAFAAASCAGVELFALVVEDLGLPFLRGVGGHHGIGIMAVLHLLNALDEYFQDIESLEEKKDKLRVKTE